MAYINPVYARIVSRHLRQDGIGEEEIFAGTGLTEEDLWALTELSLAAFLQILENAERLQPALRLGFLIGQHHNVMSLGPLGTAMAAAPTIRDGLQAIESFTGLQATYVKVSLHSYIGGLSLRFQYTDNPGATLLHHAEATLMLLQWYIEAVSGKVLDDVEYHLAYPAPAHAAEYANYLHGRPRFNQKINALQLPSHWLDIRSPYYHQEGWLQSKLRLSQRLRELGTTEKGIYSQYVLARLRSQEPPLPGLTAIAADLHVSERTLNRRLKAEGTGFRELRGELIQEWAKEHLSRTKASVESIAMTLGYQDAANFRRAFRSRFGMTPSDYRAGS
jgi:AraC-like DNA-binding protein